MPSRTVRLSPFEPQNGLTDRNTRRCLHFVGIDGEFAVLANINAFSRPELRSPRDHSRK
jgi:hypothetical protein